MDMKRALTLLAEVHTKDDDRMGFTVHAPAFYLAPFSPITHHEYTEAWRIIRKMAKLQTEPKKTN